MKLLHCVYGRIYMRSKMLLHAMAMSAVLAFCIPSFALAEEAPGDENGSDTVTVVSDSEGQAITDNPEGDEAVSGEAGETDGVDSADATNPSTNSDADTEKNVSVVAKEDNDDAEPVNEEPAAETTKVVHEPTADSVPAPGAKPAPAKSDAGSCEIAKDPEQEPTVGQSAKKDEAAPILDAAAEKVNAKQENKPVSDGVKTKKHDEPALAPAVTTTQAKPKVAKQVTTAKRASAVPASDKVKSGWYTIKTKLGTKYSIVVKNSGTSNGTTLLLKNTTVNPASAFKLKKVGNYYRVYVGIAPNKFIELSGTSADIRDKNDKSTLFSLQYDKKLKGYRFVNAATGLALAVKAKSASNGAAICGKKKSAKSSAQVFILKKRPGLITKDVYALRPVQDKVRALTADKGAGYMYWYTKDADQKWFTKPVTGKENTYVLESLDTGKRLMSSNNKQVKVKKAALTNKYAWWTPSFGSNGIIWRSVANGKPLSAKGGAYEASEAMNKQYGAPASRQFKMDLVPAIDDGRYEIRSSENSGFSLGVVDASKSAGADAKVRSRKEANNQKWVYDTKSRTLKNQNSGLMLTATDKSSGSIVEQRKASNAKSQQWNVTYLGSGKYRVSSALNSSFVLTAASAKEGAAVRNSKDKGLARQKWKIQSTLVAVNPKGFNLIKDIVNNGHGRLRADHVVIHETANPGATARNHRDLWAGNNYYSDYAVHYTLDWTRDCYQCVPEDRKCWQVGNGNSRVLGIELCHATNSSDFKKVWDAGVQWAAWQLKRHDWGIDKLISHNECRTLWGGTDHTDPDDYFEYYGKSWSQFKAAVKRAL